MSKQLAANYWQELTSGVGDAWNRFWFQPADSRPLALVRIGTGLLTAVHFLSFWSDLTRWFAGNGLLPPETVRRLTEEEGVANYGYSLLNLVTRPGELWGLEIVAIVAAILLALGVFSRASALVSLVMLLSFVHRAPMISGLGEPVLAFLLFYLCLAPSGEWLGVNAWLKQRKSHESPTPSVLANLSLRLIQVHLAMFLFMIGMSKLSAEPWWTGDAMWFLIAQTHSRPVDLTFLRGAQFLVNAWTHAFIAFEFLFPILIWNRLARPILLAIGLVLWVSLALVSGQLIFSLSLIVASGAFWSVPGLETKPALA
jgi:hypothetical protein